MCEDEWIKSNWLKYNEFLLLHFIVSWHNSISLFPLPSSFPVGFTVSSSEQFWQHSLLTVKIKKKNSDAIWMLSNLSDHYFRDCKKWWTKEKEGPTQNTIQNRGDARRIENYNTFLLAQEKVFW